MHILDDPDLSPRLRALLTRAERAPAMSAEQIRDLARTRTPSGSEAPAPSAAIEAMVRFEERYGGLWYPLLGSNGMEHGLRGEPTVRPGPHGWSFGGILDGDATWALDVLLDGRTAMTLAGRPRLINSGIAQRLEAHAQVARVRYWPHVTMGFAVGPGRTPTAAGIGFPPLDVEATGPAGTWWGDGESAVHLELHTWWGSEDLWIARCFAREAGRLASMAESVRQGVTGGAWREEHWCIWCSDSRRSMQPCLPESPTGLPAADH
ncbi:hypothetical protein OHT52_16320 [Streptomyces sp. NBC_00247]|uniref:hypothetical protein n=1 Tax=Streptomyces sp. NBC_00247 TaxID=2975689 RepID=UPI002E2BA7CB|nr:hypothetical protein [Streptomyces sp. NBC_00247]